MKVLVIAPHPDDETLGCGGSIFRHKDEGDEIYWTIVTSIASDDGWPEKKVLDRKKEIEQISKTYNFSDTFNLNIPAAKVDTLPISTIVNKISKVFNSIKPEIIYIPNAKDVHTDHQLIALALQSTFKWFRYPYIKRILMYETPSETDFNFLEKNNFQPQVFLDISKYIDKKIKTMEIYKDEMGEYPFPRSERVIRALSVIRGSQSGYDAAEAFQLVYERK